jgi:predicted helicase
VEAVRLAVEEHTRKYGSGDTGRFLKEQVLKNYYAFELMMAPYAVSHLKAGFLMDELGYPMEGDERFQLYLTNTLSMEDLYLSDVPGLSSLSEESHEAAQVKQKPILVILGIPPYSGISANQSEWTERLLKTDMDGAQSYYTIDGQPLGEKNPKWLQDDYVKFLRFAQWKVQRAGEGVVGMITNHGYLDNPTFRGMRQSLMKTFNQITVLNLHGSSLKKEKAPDGNKDENVFDIRTGVAIVLLVKKRGAEGCIVKQADLYGTREVKYDWLERHRLSNTEFKDTHAKTPWYFFAQNALDEMGKYQDWERIDQIFPRNSVGIVTGRDDLTINFNRHDLWVKILNFSRLDTETARTAYQLGKDSRDWQVALAQKDLKNSGPTEEKIVPILYRPFDQRYTYFTGRSRGFQCMPRGEVMRHMLAGENLALISARSNKSHDMNHFFITDTISEAKAGERTTQSGLFPLYIYPAESESNLFNEPTPNLDPALVARLTAAYGLKPSPEEILYYIYGVFYSNLYRKKYAEALRIDFSRVPFTRDVEVFTSMSMLGKRLADLHLLKSAELDPPTARYQGSGTQDTIEKVEYDEASGRVRINDAKYFEGIPPEVWNYQIGGYQVLNKYLKDRKGRRMDDPVRYVHIATALARTIEIQNEIDRVYPTVEESIL